MNKRFNIFDDKTFIRLIHWTENIVSKSLSIALLVVIFVALIKLFIVLVQTPILNESSDFFSTTLIKIFGLFLNILIALELLENVTSYFRKHIIQVELVVVTALIAVARKIIVLDPEKVPKTDLIPLGVAVLALSVSYWLLRNAVERRPRKRIITGLKRNSGGAKTKDKS